jgi:hypothetical protein
MQCFSIFPRIFWDNPSLKLKGENADIDDNDTIAGMEDVLFLFHSLYF